MPRPVSPCVARQHGLRSCASPARCSTHGLPRGKPDDALLFSITSIPTSPSDPPHVRERKFSGLHHRLGRIAGLWPAIADMPDGLGTPITGRLTHVDGRGARGDRTQHGDKLLDGINLVLREILP